MPRHPARRPIDRTALVVIVALQRASKDASPSDPSLLQGIIGALLERIGRSSLSEERFLRTQIRIAAGLEQFLPQQARQLVLPSLLSIAYAPAPTGAHWIESVKLQWNTLAGYFEQQDFGSKARKARNAEACRLWIREHLPELRRLLALVPCACKYQKSLDGSLDKLRYPLSSASVAHSILAELHRTGPEQIRKWLSRTSRARQSGEFVKWVTRLQQSKGLLEDYTAIVGSSIPYFNSLVTKDAPPV